MHVPEGTCNRYNSILSTGHKLSGKGFSFILWNVCAFLVVSHKIHSPEHFSYISFKTRAGEDFPLARREGDDISLLSPIRDPTGRGKL